MRREGRETFRRMERVLLQDKFGGGYDVLNIVKSDIRRVLAGYMEIEDVSVKLEPDDYGGYVFVAEARATRMKGVNTLK